MTVRIQPGAYPEQLTIQKNDFAGVAEADRIIIEADPDLQPGAAVLTGSPGPQCTDKFAIRIRRSNFITIRGLTITGTGAQAITMMGGNNGNSGIHIELNRIFGNGNSGCNGGIEIARNNPGTLIVNNLIYSNGRNAISFVDADGGPHYVINNTIYGNQWNGVDVARNHTVTVANNIINNNGRAGGTTGGRLGVRRESSTIPKPAGIKLLNNLVCGNAQGEISVQVLDTTDSSNFTPFGNEGPGIGALSGCELVTNLFDDINGPDNRPNTADDDFTLKPNSLAIDVGMDPRTLGFNPSYNPIFEADFVIEGIRPTDGNADRTPAFDAGAFEHPNAHPTAKAGPDQTTYRGQLVTLSGSHSNDPEGAPLSYQWSIVSQPFSSNIVLNASNAATPSFTPLILGVYNFQLIVNDGQFSSAPASVRISVLNRPPAAENASVSATEDTEVTISATAADSDDPTLSFSIVTGPSHGTLGTVSTPTCVSNGVGSTCIATVLYKPNQNFSGSDSFTFKVNDGSLDSNVATASIAVNAVNDVPTASSTTATTDEDVSVNIALSASDADSASLTFAIVNGPSNGSLGAVSPPNCVNSSAGANCTVTVTYTPSRDFKGSDSFSFNVTDGAADSNTASVSMTVNAVNDAPVANGQSVATNEDAPVTIILTATDVDNSTLNFNIVSNPINGNLSAIAAPNCTVNGAGVACNASVTYSSGANFGGSDTFSFQVSDGSVASNIAIVSVSVNAVNDGPVAANDFYSTDRDTAFSIGAPGVLGNDNDLDTQASSFTAVLVNPPVNAADFILNPDGSFSYTPYANFAGVDAFTYKTGDGVTDSNEATVTIAVLQPNNVPIATNDIYNTEKDLPLAVLAPGVLGNDNDLDTPTIGRTAHLIGGPSHAASFSLKPDGSFDYAPQPNFIGTDSFTYKVNDGTNDSNVAMVTIAVIAPDTFPVAKNDSEHTNEDAATSIPVPGVLGNDSIALLTAPIAVLVSGPTRALSFALNADGSFNYTSPNDFYGADGFTYRIFDGTNYSNLAMVNIDVAAVNDAPVAQSQSVSTNENTPVIVTLIASDIDSQSLSFSIANPPSNGSVGNISTPNCTIQGQAVTCTATVSYTPAGNYSGPDSFTLTASDGLVTSAAAMVSITVIQVNRPPTANAGGPYTGTPGVAVQFNGSGNDPNGNPITFEWTFGDGGTGSGSTPTHTYSAAGTYTVTLTITDAFGASGISQTTATISSALVLNSIGNKTVNLGETLTFTVAATTGTGAPVSLYIAPLPLMTNASFSARTGVFTFRPSATQVGSYQLTFSASSGNNSASETITITVPNPPPGGSTSVRGRVVNLAQTPLGNVSVTLKSSGHTAVTGADGFFTISGVPSGTQQLLVNGRQSNLGVYAILAIAVELIDGVLNDLNSAISLPDVDVEAEVQVSPTFNTTVTNPSLPGVELEIIGGSATNPDGTPFTGKLSINPVPDYGRPESRPEELRPGFAVTIQPAGIRFNPPARITFPNADGMAAGNELNLWSLSPDSGKFNIVGKSAVSADGQSIITVEGGVSASAWHFPLASSPSISGAEGNSYCGSCRTPVGSEANLEEGSLYQTHSLPSYRSLGQSRSISLTYSSVSADPKPIISADATLSLRAAVPPTFSTRLKLGGVQQEGELFTSSATLPEDADSNSRLSHQFDASNLATGRYSFEMTVFSNYLNSSIGGIASGNSIVINRKTSPFGSGWALTDVQQLHPQSGGGVLLTAGDGTALFFSGGPDTFVSPARDFSILARNTDGSFTRIFKDGIKINFDSRGLETSLVDRNGNATTYGYDESGRIITITESVGLVTTLSYTNGKLEKITDPAGRETHFQHDSAGNLTRITNPDGTFVKYSYDSSGRMIETVDERGNSTTYTHDFAGRFSQSSRPGGETRSLISSKFQGLPNSAMGLGAPTNPAPIVRTESATASLTDGRGNTTYFTLDSLGQVTSQRDPLGQITTTQRDPNGLPTRVTRPNGAVTTMTYDAKGNLLISTDPVGATTTLTYEPTFNQVKTIRDPKGNVTTINYDAKGNPIEVIDALNNRTQMTYDARGLLTSVTAALGTSVQTTTTFTYDARGNLLTTTNPKGDVTTLAYDSAGNVSMSTDAENRVTQFTYDPQNRLTTVLDANLKTTQYSYDPKGNLIQVRDAKNQLTTFTYDGLDRLATATNPLGLTETFTYDDNGNLTTTTNRNSQTITFNYDALNRLTSKIRPPTSTETGNQITTYGYDAVGNLRSIANPVTSVINQYDLTNRLVSSLSSAEIAQSDTIVPINVDTTIEENNSQFDGKTLQVNGRILTLTGSHTFANLSLLNGAVLRHEPTTSTKLNKLELTITGALQIDATSRIDVSGLGFLAAGRPGNPFPNGGMTLGFQQGSGSLSGGSYGGLGGSGSNSTANPVYGEFRNPNEPGSGGGAFGVPGGNGGGIVRIVAQSLSLNGVIRANGGAVDAGGSASGGSGGAVRLDVNSLSGTGSITANGSNGGGTVGGGGGGGRVAIYYQNISGFNFANVLATGATGPSVPGTGAGSVYLQGPSKESGELIIDNNNILDAGPLVSTLPPGPTSDLVLTHFRVRRGARFGVSRPLNISDTFEIHTNSGFLTTQPIAASTVNLVSNSFLAHFVPAPPIVNKLEITADTISIDTTSRIDVTGRGFPGSGRFGNPTANGLTVGFQPGSTSLAGGSYGGLGGIGSNATANAVYGDFRNPNEPGSGGGSVGAPGGSGGGLVRIVAQTLSLTGTILANGGAVDGGGSASGGSGGGIRIDVGTFSGSGSISANGSPGGGTTGGGGSGGRIAIYYQDATGFNFSNMSAFGSTGPNAINAGAGTVYLQGPARENGELLVDNNNVSAPSMSTPIPAISGTLNMTHVRVKRQGHLRIDNLLNMTGSLELNTGAEFTSSARVIADRIDLINNSVIVQLPTAATTANKVDLSANQMIVDTTSTVSAIAKGFLGGAQPGNPFNNGSGMTVGFAQGSTGSSGGSHGGLGGGFNGTANQTYDSAQDPQNPGSGGATIFRTGGNGGGVIRITAGTLILDGGVRAGGDSGLGDSFAGGGSGGAIRLDVGLLSGAGQIAARGGNGQPNSGAGGGGRIAIYYSSATGFNFATQVFVTGGTVNGAPNGQDGTIYLQQQLAMIEPVLELSPVQIAETWSSNKIGNSLAANVSRFRDLETLLERRRAEIAAQELTQRQVFSGESKIQHRKFRIAENRYVAEVAEGKLKAFASTAMLSKGTELSSGLAGSVISIPKSKSETLNGSDSAQLPNACCLLPRSGVTSQASNLAPEDLDPIYTYDLNGNRISMIDPTGLTTYTYDALNRLSSIMNNKGQVTSFTYDALGRRTSMTHANGVVTSYTYDAASQLLTLGHQLGATTINSFSYGYDKVGNRKTKTTRDGLHDYTYDVLNRLTQATNPLPTNPLESFNYDPVGNRINSNQNGSSTFNQVNQLLEDASFTYQYDNNGNMVQKTANAGGAISTYEYDAENKLVRVVSPTSTAHYRYDGLGRRVEKEVIAGTATVAKYLYDNEDILLELNGSNAIVARYTHGPGIDAPLIMEKSNQSFYYHADGLGSITELTNQSGAVVQRYTYSSFGKIDIMSDPTFRQPYTFTGREFDVESGTYYFRARQYDQTTGGFLQTDPIGASGGLSLYNYVENNPTTYIDPLGLDTLDVVANISAGLGDELSLGLTKYVREFLGSNSVIDQCSFSYYAASWAGFFHGLAITGAGGLYGGAKTILWSGKGARGAAEAARAGGKLLTDTPIGKVLDLVDEKVVELPSGVWKAASAVFAANAKGEVQVFLRNPGAGGVWNSVERPVINLVNKLHSTVVGSPSIIVKTP